MPQSFVHLRVHTEYSMINGICRVKPLVSKTAELGMPALAMTDQNNICGLVRFYNTALSNGIKPITGVDMWLRSEAMGDELFRVVFLCLSQEGYTNLKRIISRAYMTNQVRGIPVVEQEWLHEWNEGLIVLSGGREGDVGKALLNNNMDLAAQCLGFWSHHFPDRYYIELQRTGRENEDDYIHAAVGLAQGAGTPVVATNDVHFISPDDFGAHEARICISQGRVLEDPRRPKEYSAEQYLRSPEEMIELFQDIPEAIENTVEIARRCSVELKLGTYYLPRFPTGDLDEAAYLCKVSEEGLEERLDQLMDRSAPEFAEQRKAYDERLKIELDVINQMGFPGYFLIVADFIQWAKNNAVPVGPGRGSGAGSLVAYALKITDLDPLEYDLLFERFLNPERVSMPDFDVDFCMDGRDRVIDYVAETYGRESVSQIITFGTMAAKAVVRDVARVLGKPYGLADRLSKAIPPTPGMTLAKAWEEEPALQDIVNGDEEAQEIWDMAKSLEGIIRQAGKHAGGVVISPSLLTDFTAIYCDENASGLVSQFDKDDVEKAGLVKFDFLGLKTLTIIDWAMETVNRQRAEEGLEPLNIETISTEDEETFTLLKAADTTAVFQLESHGMKNLIERLQPSNFEDIIALVALFRPGPLQSGMVDDFINRKHGKAELAFPHPDYQHDSLQPILEPTYGVIVYQEQVMQIAQVLAGYSLGGADLLRRAMGKKKPEEMAKQRSIFESGAVKQGIDSDLAMNIFDLVEKFAGYGFNKSHSAAYALVAYQTAFLKAHYPAAFMAAVMSADMDNTDKVVAFVDDCMSHGIKILPPDVNKGEYKFTVDGEAIIYGIGAIKGVGEGAIESFVNERKENGPYKDLFDFCNRVELKKVNRRVLESLIRAGALDSLGPDRAVMTASLDEAIKAAEQRGRAEAIGQNDLFGNVFTSDQETGELNWAKVRPWPEDQVLQGEKETLGLYLTGHPIDRYLDEVKAITSHRIAELQPTRRGENVTVAGLIVGIRVMKTKKGDRFAIVSLDDRSGRIDVMVYADTYEAHKNILTNDNVILVEGDVSVDDFNGGLRMSVRSITDFVAAREQHARYLLLELNEPALEDNIAEQLHRNIKPCLNGKIPVKVKFITDKADAELSFSDEWKVQPTDELLYHLEGLKGCDKARLVY
ncbi:DNA polymerase III subunit alpha [Pleionea sp. CnH1-48]|uniref:DNA polymerase III subunit alpha n=1 Tax=Pleionea sp. CnH1-48 TaxID=2954494 RepID=UPI0020983454|nr:DNA polymerase III subunit alpha [Pleionea sp. CnH1-48]MCO7226486.1 DNA polymerase III subunit alpha [Pleionea sp. CnH1-48]